MSELADNLKSDFVSNDKEYRHAYAEETLNTVVASQIKVLREQRNLTQHQLAELAEMKQSMISRYENANYSSWSLNTLRKLSEALDVWLDVRFRSFGEFVREVDSFSRESLEVPLFADEPFFQQTAAPISSTAFHLNAQTPVTTAILDGTVPHHNHVVPNFLNNRVLLANAPMYTLTTEPAPQGVSLMRDEIAAFLGAWKQMDWNVERNAFRDYASQEPTGTTTVVRELAADAA
jgi:transcriptional regulator with XRE-family HTH domain